MEDFVDKIDVALGKRELITLGARCTVDYSGRAESFLPSGDRLIVIKQDGTLLIHQPDGSSPVNYMKDKTSHTVIRDDNGFLLESNNLALKEYMNVLIEKVHFMHSQKLEDGQKIMLAGTEADMAKMIMKNPTLIEEGFKTVSQEEQTKYGFIDVLGYDRSGNLVVVECKRYSAGLSAVQQLRRYVEKIIESKGIKNVRGIMAAPKITGNAESMLYDFGYEFKNISPPNYLEKFNKHQKSIFEF